MTSCSHGVPPLTDPPAELLAQAALFLILHDLPPSTPGTISWTRLAGPRFGGDVHARTLVLETETGATASVKVSSTPASGALYDIDITMQPANAASGSASTPSAAKFRGVSATLGGLTALSDARYRRPSGTWRVGGCRADPCLLWWTRCDGPAPCSGMGGGPRRRTFGSAGRADAESCGRGARCRQRPRGEGPGRCRAREHEDGDGVASAGGWYHQGYWVRQGRNGRRGWGVGRHQERRVGHDQVGVFSTCCILSAKMVY